MVVVIKSDLLGSVYFCGRMPYPGVDAIDLARLLDEGLRLVYPTNAANSSEIYVTFSTYF